MPYWLIVCAGSLRIHVIGRDLRPISHGRIYIGWVLTYILGNEMAAFSLKTKLVVLSFACSILPYIILWAWYLPDFTKSYDFSLQLAFIGSLIWLIFTLMAWKRDHSLSWLFAFFPIAFGPWLFLVYFFIHARLFGFAP